MRIKYFFLTTIIFVVTVFGQQKIDTSNIGLVLKISLQRDTIFLGEPLILTSTLINKSSQPIEAPTLCADVVDRCGITSHILVEPFGKRNPYYIGGHSLMMQPIAGYNTQKILPDDSIYWRKLYWLENFGTPESLESFVSGRYQIVSTYLYSASFKDGSSIDNRISNSTFFILSYNPQLIRTIKPIRGYLKNFFWWDGQFLERIEKKGKLIISSEARAESLFQYLFKIRKSNSPFSFYTDYLLPTIASLTENRDNEAVLLADEFIGKYQNSPLSEEMAFWKGRLIYRELYKKPERDSIMEVWLKPVFKQYPKNAYRFAFRKLWEKFE